MPNYDDLSLAVASFGGNNKVIFDDMEKPSIMVGIPKMKYSDLITGGTDDVLDVFKVDGVERDVLYISKYHNIVVGDRAYSLPMKDPKTDITIDQSLAFCRNKGEGWSLTPNGLWSAILLWCNRNGFIPRGNNDHGFCHEAKFEKGIAPTGYRTLTGSGPATWYHDGTFAGIADFGSNVAEWVSGLRLMNAEIQIIPEGNCMKADCDLSADSPEWRAILPDGTLVQLGTAGTLKYSYEGGKFIIGITANEDWHVRGLLSQLKMADGVVAPQIIKALGLYPDDNNIYSTQRHGYEINARNEVLAYWGGHYGYDYYGAVSLGLRYNRTISAFAVGFRCAYDEKLAAGS